MADQPWRRKAGDAIAARKRREDSAYAEGVQQRQDAERRRLELEAAKRAEMSPYELMADALAELFGDAVMAALTSPDFAAELAARGYALAVLKRGAEIPEPPYRWMEEALSINESVYPVDVCAALWKQAWKAGWEAKVRARVEEKKREGGGD